MENIKRSIFIIGRFFFYLYVWFRYYTYFLYFIYVPSTQIQTVLLISLLYQTQTFSFSFCSYEEKSYVLEMNTKYSDEVKIIINYILKMYTHRAN